MVRLNFTGHVVLKGDVKGLWWRRRHQSSCCCLFMQLSNIRAVGSLSGTCPPPHSRLSLLDLWRLVLFEQFLSVLPVSCEPPSVSPGMWVESAHTPAFVKANMGGGNVFPPSKLRQNVFFSLLTLTVLISLSHVCRARFSVVGVLAFFREQNLFELQIWWIASDVYLWTANQGLACVLCSVS